MKRIGLWLAILALAPSHAIAQARPPSQRTGPVYITGDGSTGNVSDMTVKAPGVPAGQSLKAWMTSPFFNGGATFDPQGLRQGPRGDVGYRGPVFTWTDPPGDSPAGANAGFQTWVGDNPVATPGVGDTVGGTVAVINGKNRKKLFGMNILTQVCNASLCGEGYTDAKTTGMEIEAGTQYPNTPTDPWGSDLYRKNGLEMTAQAASAGRITAAITTWANDNSGVGWWNTGLALSRVYDVGILGKRHPGNGIDVVPAFQTAFIYDNSDSFAALKIGAGNHRVVFDMSEAANFGDLLRGKLTSDTLLPLRNISDHNMAISIDSGLTTPKSSDIYLSDNSVPKWILGKDSTQAFRIFDAVGGTLPLNIPSNGGPVQMPKVAVSAQMVVPLSAPASSSSACTAGQIQFDATYLYTCVATNSWKRTPLGSAW